MKICDGRRKDKAEVLEPQRDFLFAVHNEVEISEMQKCYELQKLSDFWGLFHAGNCNYGTQTFFRRDNYTIPHKSREPLTQKKLKKSENSIPNEGNCGKIKRQDIKREREKKYGQSKDQGCVQAF